MFQSRHSVKTSENMRVSEEQLAAVIDSAMDAIISINEEQRIVLFNAAAERMFMISADEIVGDQIERLIPERFRTHHESHIKEFGRTNVSKRSMGLLGPIFGRRTNGEEFPIEASISQIETKTGKLFTVIMRDITKRVHAEQRFRMALESMPSALIMVDADGGIVFANSLVEMLFGYTRQELMNQPLEMLIPERFRATHPDYRSSFFASPQARPMGAGRDLFARHKDGHDIPVEIGLQPMSTEDGNFVLASIIDITERKQAEETLRRSRQQLAAVIGSAMDAIITVDDEQRIILFNNAAEHMFLYPSEDAIGQPLSRFIPARFREVHQSHIRDFGRTKVSKRRMGALGAIFGLRADGNEFPIEASISQIESDGKRLYTVILRDITERKQAEASLKEQARILDLAPVLIRDINDRILFWNAGAEQMYGWTREEARDKITHQLFRTEFPQPLEELKARLYARGHWEGELVHHHRDGKRIVVASHWVLHKDDDDKAKAILEINNDITERRLAEEEVRRLNEELEQRVQERTAELQAVNKELEAFSYSVSHDLRAPLRHINGFSQALLEDYYDRLDEAGREYLRQVRGASEEMAQLIDDVLQLARTTRTEMHREPVDLSELARGIIARLQKLDVNRAVNVEIEDQLTVYGDRRLLQMALMNLLQNAWKFTTGQPQPTIQFGKQTEKDRTVFFVRDNGAGFDMRYANKLFGVFQRLHKGDEFEGTGIGLATVQRIINRHGGSVWAEGAVNEGATFYFTLPEGKGEK